jgi:hypothetical protein
MSECTHTLAERWDDCSDGGCPFCLAARIRELEGELLTCRGVSVAEAKEARDAIESAAIERIKNGIDYRLNEYLCEMEPDYDDSITGFNEAWDIVRKYFRALKPTAPGTPPLE